jgi:hypothetical protein
LNHSAQRCRDNGAATLGDSSPIEINPERVVAGRVPYADATLSGLGALFGRQPGVGPILSDQRRAEGWNPFRILNALVLVLLTLCLFFTATFAHAQTVATPVISPASGTTVPVTVSISDPTPGAVIRYTLDGTVPTVTNQVFTTNLVFTSQTMLRAQAFVTGMSNSATAYAYYGLPAAVTDTGYYRTVTNDEGNLLPLIRCTATNCTVTTNGATPVTCFTIQEQLPAVVTPVAITGGGQWLPALGVIRWGPFTNLPAITVSYRISGLSGSYPINGQVSADGIWHFVPPTSTATILSGSAISMPSAPTPVSTPVIALAALPAESGALSGGAVVASTNAGYKGTGFVSFPASGGLLHFNGVNGGMGGSATLLVRYALGGSACAGQLIVNGVTNPITFNSTTTWTNWGYATTSITLSSGTANNIGFASSGSGLANLDEITVMPASPAAPASVMITDGTPGATIHYTLDGSIPTTTSPAYTGPIAVTGATVVRAVAYAGSQASAGAVANFAAPPTFGPAVVSHSVNTNTAWAPVMNLAFTPGTGVVCQALVETVPSFLVISNVSGGGVWTNGVVRWGPYFSKALPLSFSYQALGPAGSYTVSSRWSHDGTGVNLGSTNLIILTSSSGGITIPVAPAQLPTPVLSPALSATLPVSVTISNAVAGAAIYYTTDGSTPTMNSALYSTALNLTGVTTLRAQAFLVGWLPSAASVGYYGSATNSAGTSLTLMRVITVNSNPAPFITLTVTPVGKVSSYTVTEYVPPGLAAFNITSNGVWNAPNQTVKWGPFSNQTAVLAYQVSGQGGAFVCRGKGSVDGSPAAITGQSNLVVTSTSGTVSAPTAPVKLPLPVLTPANSAMLPTNVTASCSVNGAALYYTLDGSVPTTNSALYSDALHFASFTTLRVRAFLAGDLPSDAAVGYYEPASSVTGLTITRAITNNPGYAPLVALTATPIGNVSAYTVVETVPYGLTPFNVSPAGSWSAASQKLKWGPFTNQILTLTYQVCGVSGTNLLAGNGSVDGYPAAVTGQSNLVVDLSLMPTSAPPAIVLQPLSQPVAADFSLVLYVQAVGAPAPVYFWRMNGALLTNASSPMLTIADFQAANVGAYDVVVSNAVGTVTSQPALITLLTGPNITNQPQSLAVRVGQTAVFYVGATAVPAPSYQWLFNGTPLNGQTAPTLTLFNTTTAESGDYDVVVVNPVSSATSQPATLLVQPPLALTNVVRLSAGQIQFQLPALAGDQYILQYKDELTDSSWVTLPQVGGTNGMLILTDTPGAARRRFYRVQEQ